MEDVDERPRFVNEPKPYWAVVKPDTFVGSVVFTFQAVDEQGDLLDDPDGVGYQQVNTGDGNGTGMRFSFGSPLRLMGSFKLPMHFIAIPPRGREELIEI